MQHTLRNALLACLCSLGLAAHAWQSGAETKPGPAEARRTWGWSPGSNEGTSPNEHARLLYLAAIRAGIPSQLNQTLGAPRRLNLFTRDKDIEGVGKSFSSAPLTGNGSANRVSARFLTLAGFASLPDHAFSVADWANGNETCPPGTTGNGGASLDAQSCHGFEYLGPLNSTHFVPQSQIMYSWYHQLAMAIADRCKLINTNFLNSYLSPINTGALTTEMVTECEQEALILEATGQHFMQDAWAIGHMWQRWGFPTYEQFSGYGFGADAAQFQAIAVATLAGLVHGSESITGAPDFMSAGGRFGVDFIAPNGAIAAGIGDLHLDELLADPQSYYTTEREGLLNCSASGLIEVYERTAMLSGGGFGSFPRVSPTGSNCFGQRATNISIQKGIGFGCRYDFVADPKKPLQTLGCDTRLFTPTFASRMVFVVSAKQGIFIQPFEMNFLLDKVRSETVKMLNVALVSSLLSPNGTDLAESGITTNGRFLGVVRNSEAGMSSSSVPTPYTDPAPPWPSPTESASDKWTPSRWLARSFNKSHVYDWCGDPEAFPAALQKSVADAKAGQVQDAIDGACAVCTEFSYRQVTGINNGPSICEAAGRPGQAISIPPELRGTSANPKAFARHYCGCEDYDVVKDFASSLNRTSDVWRYGWWGLNSEGNGFHQFTGFTNYDQVIDAWNEPTIDQLGAPAVSHNVTDKEIDSVRVPFRSTPIQSIRFLPSEVVMHPGQGNRRVGIRLIVPFAGTYSLQGQFSGRDNGMGDGPNLPPTNAGTTTDVHVLRNNVELFGGTITQGGAYVLFPALTLELNRSDVIDFIVGNLTGDFTSDSTGLSARLTRIK